MNEELRKMRIELQERFDILKEMTGINLNANKYEKRQCRSYLAFFKGLDILLSRQENIKSIEQKSHLTATNLAEVSGLGESTIEHNLDFRAIIAAIEPKDGEEPVILLSEHKRIVNELKEQIKEKDRRLDKQRNLSAELALERTDHARTKDELRHLKDHTEDIYRKLGLFLEKHPEAMKPFTTNLPEIVMFLPFKPQGNS